MSGISTHILDTTLGRPAANVAVSLYRQTDTNDWEMLTTATTDPDGRCKQLVPDETTLTAGVYRIRFETAGYYNSRATKGLYPFVEVNFNVRAEDDHLHIPLLLTANGYTTYRGS